MNFALTDEQEFLKEAARGALSRFKTVEAAREALDGGELPDLWPTARRGRLARPAGVRGAGGAGLGVMEGMLVFSELGRVLAGVALLGHLPATLPARPRRRGATRRSPTATRARPTCPRSRRATSTTAGASTPRLGSTRSEAPVIADDGTVTGAVPWVPDAPGADVLVVVGADGRAALVQAADATIEAVEGYDPTRSLGHVSFDGAPGTLLELDTGQAAAAWYLAQALLAAESLGAVELALEVSVAYAKERFTFGRAIGSYQAVKHELVEILRRLENGRSLMYYAGWAGAGQARRVPARGLRVPARRGPGARPRLARADLRPRRDRRDLGARRAAVLPPRAAVAAAAGGHGGRRRPRGRRAAHRSAGRRGLASLRDGSTSGSSTVRGM